MPCRSNFTGDDSLFEGCAALCSQSTKLREQHCALCKCRRCVWCKEAESAKPSPSHQLQRTPLSAVSAPMPSPATTSATSTSASGPSGPLWYSRIVSPFVAAVVAAVALLLVILCIGRRCVSRYRSGYTGLRAAGGNGHAMCRVCFELGDGLREYGDISLAGVSSVKAVRHINIAEHNHNQTMTRTILHGTSHHTPLIACE